MCIYVSYILPIAHCLCLRFAPAPVNRGLGKVSRWIKNAHVSGTAIFVKWFITTPIVLGVIKYISRQEGEEKSFRGEGL